MPVARYNACESIEHIPGIETISSGSVRSSAGFLYNAGVSICSAHTGTIQGWTTIDLYF